MKNYIETERIIMRPIQLFDAEDIFEYAKDEDTGPRAGWPPHKDIQTTKGLIEKWMQPDNKEKVFAIIYKPDNKVVGTMGYEKNAKNERNSFAKKIIENEKIVFEIGNVISKSYWGKGLSTECLKAMLDYLFVEENADVVMTCHAEPNLASGRVQEKCGMKIVEIFEDDHSWYNTDNRQHVVRAKTREEWEQKLLTI